ncbi:ABC transporter transmembrane domain-containing protein [Actinophytocola sp.]|uniref:ABC transporter transmembrane domain-containing protein n=1 Tax=Actinophytocola sp. TaxID=1872138 RepID=UPI003D6B12CD
MSTQTDQSAWRVLLGNVSPFRAALMLGGVLSLATAATGLALPVMVRELIDELASGRGIVGLLVLMSVLVLANAGIGAVGSFLLERTAESVVLVARRRLVSRLLWLRIPALDDTEPGDLMSRVSADTTLQREVSTQSLVSAVTSTLTLVATVTLMALLDPVLLVVTLVALGAAQVVIGVVVPRISRAAKQAQEAVGVMSAALERALGNLRTGQGLRRRGTRTRPAAPRGGGGAAVSARRSGEAVAGNTGVADRTTFVHGGDLRGTLASFVLRGLS